MENKKNLRFFVIMTNVIFWLFLGVCALIMVLGVPMETVSKYAPVLGSWASFFVLMVWAKKLLPGTSRKAFIKGLFEEKIKWHLVLLSVLIPTAVFAAGAIVLYAVFKVPLGELINLEFSSYPAMFLLQLVMGPTGEEPGWRGYYLIGSVKSRGVLKGALMTGLFWGLWHCPLWFMEGYSPLILIAYIAGFMAAVIIFSIILGYIYLKHRNLLYCIIMHQLFNFLTGLFCLGTDKLPADKGMVAVIVTYAVCYALVAVVTVSVNKD